MTFIVLAIIRTNTFRKNQCDSFFAYPFAKMNQFGEVSEEGWKMHIKI